MSLRRVLTQPRTLAQRPAIEQPRVEPAAAEQDEADSPGPHRDDVLNPPVRSADRVNPSVCAGIQRRDPQAEVDGCQIAQVGNGLSCLGPARQEEISPPEATALAAHALLSDPCTAGSLAVSCLEVGAELYPAAQQEAKRQQQPSHPDALETRRETVVDGPGVAATCSHYWFISVRAGHSDNRSMHCFVRPGAVRYPVRCATALPIASHEQNYAIRARYGRYGHVADGNE